MTAWCPGRQQYEPPGAGPAGSWSCVSVRARLRSCWGRHRVQDDSTGSARSRASVARRGAGELRAGAGLQNRAGRRRALDQGPRGDRVRRPRADVRRRESGLSRPARRAPTPALPPRASSPCWRTPTATDVSTSEPTSRGNLTFPNGIMPWDGGVFVSCAPDLLYLKDTDNDGVADERRVVLTGFDASRTSQLRFSHPTLGIDNWVYLTSGLTGGRVTAPDQPERSPVTLGTSDSRFNPLTLAFELTGGQGQYGLTFDDYGRRFTCSNRRPVMHVVLETAILEAQSAPRVLRRPWKTSRPPARRPTVWPISGDTTTASFIPSLMSAPHAGTFTAASGVHIHRGDALPAADRDSIFICESAQNLVQRQILIAERRDVHVAAGANGPRVPVVARHLVQAGLRGQRSRRRPLHRRHVPPDHRPSAVRAGAEPRAARLPGGQGTRPDLSDRRRRLETRTGSRSTWAAMNAAELARHARASECVVAGNRAAAARRAARPDGDPAPSRDRARQPHAKWRVSTRCGPSTASAGSRPLTSPRPCRIRTPRVRENAVRLAGSRDRNAPRTC